MSQIFGKVTEAVGQAVVGLSWDKMFGNWLEKHLGTAGPASDSCPGQAASASLELGGAAATPAGQRVGGARHP